MTYSVCCDWPLLLLPCGLLPAICMMEDGSRSDMTYGIVLFDIQGIEGQETCSLASNGEIIDTFILQNLIFSIALDSLQWLFVFRESVVLDDLPNRLLRR